MPKASTHDSSRGRAACLSVTFAISAGLLGLAPSSFAQQEPKPFGASDMHNIWTAQEYNAIRFDHYFEGRAFQATLPIYRIGTYTNNDHYVRFGPDEYQVR